MNLVVKKLTTKNPWLHRSFDSISREALAEDSDFVVQDSEDSPDKYVPICQMCSIMAVYWAKGDVGDKSEFATVSKSRQEAIVTVAAKNPTNELQVAWAKGLTRFSEITKAQVKDLIAGDRLILYGPGHVTALKVVPAMDVQRNCEVYDPETASVDYWNLSQWLEMSGATTFLSSKSFAASSDGSKKDDDKKSS